MRKFIISLLLLGLPFSAFAALQPGASDKIWTLPNGDSWSIIEGDLGCQCGWLALRRAGEVNWIGDRVFDVYEGKIAAAGGPELYVKNVLLPAFSKRLQELYGATVPMPPPADVEAAVWQILRQRVKFDPFTFTFSLV